MSEPEAIVNAGRNLERLKADVTREVAGTFQASTSPTLSKDQVQRGVQLLFRLLAHSLGDPDLDAVGEEILAALDRWFRAGDLVKLADRYEPFCKFLLRVIEPAKFARLQAETGDRLSAAKVLKALGLVSNKALSLFESCTWEQFPPADVVGQPDFLEHVARTYLFRNVEDHRARALNRLEKAQVAHSFCVFVVWAVIKFEQVIEGALMTAGFFPYLERVRDNFARIGARFVGLVAESRSADEYRFLDPLSALPDLPSDGEATDVSMLPKETAVTVIEAEAGAGKTTTLRFLAWQEACRLLDRKSKDGRLPVYLDLGLLCHRGQSIEGAVGRCLGFPTHAMPPIPWNSMLLLVDGINEVASQRQISFGKELGDLIARFAELRVVLAGRPNSFRGGFVARVVLLRRFSAKQVGEMFSRTLGDGAKASQLLTAVLESPFLSSWTRTPLHAAMIADIAERQGITTLSNHAATVRRFIRSLFRRELRQSLGKTVFMKKERLLSRLAFETKSARQWAFAKNNAISILGSVKSQIGIPTLDVPCFIMEVVENALLEEVDHEALRFAHELYSDYFAAVELEAREGVKKGLGVDFALAHFAELQWQECIRLFAGLASTASLLIERGAESNPWLAWLLLRDGRIENQSLREKVADAAYCMLSGGLDNPTKAALAGACVYVLADVQRAVLLREAITKQRQAIKPTGLWGLNPGQQKTVRERQRTLLLPLGYGLFSILHQGLTEQRSKQEGRFCDASRVAIGALQEIKAAGILMAILTSWPAKIFDPTSLVPGAILDAILALGVDQVFEDEIEAHNGKLVEWLSLASEAGLKKAWPAYGRVLGWANPIYCTGTDYEPDKALYWLRKAHDGNDINGSVELALLLIKEPVLGGGSGEGERLLRDLATGHAAARYQLGKLLMDGDGLVRNEAEGFELLLSLAEAGHSLAQRHLLERFLSPGLSENSWLSETGDLRLSQLPSWALVFRDRLDLHRLRTWR